MSSPIIFIINYYNQKYKNMGSKCSKSDKGFDQYDVPDSKKMGKK